MDVGCKAGWDVVESWALAEVKAGWNLVFVGLELAKGRGWFAEFWMASC